MLTLKWTEDEVRCFEAGHSVGDVLRARLLSLGPKLRDAKRTKGTSRNRIARLTAELRCAEQAYDTYRKQVMAETKATTRAVLKGLQH